MCVLSTTLTAVLRHYACVNECRCKYLTEGSAACALGLATGVVLLLGHEFLDWEIVTQLLEFNAAGFFT